MPADASADSCPRCGERMVPVLDRTPTPPEASHLLADSPVHLHCPSCSGSGAG